MVLGGLFSLSEKDGDLEKARMFTEKLIQLAELLKQANIIRQLRE